jgi:hypothetical protein
MQPNDQYGFILNDNKSGRSGPAFLQDPKKRNIFAVAFVIIVLMLVFIVVSIFSSIGKTDVNGLQSVAVQQNRIIKLTTTGLKNAKDPSTRTDMAVLQAFLLSDLAESKRLLGPKLSEGVSLVSYDIAIDTLLERAAQRNQYDDVLSENIDVLVAEYKTRLNSAINAYRTSTVIAPVLDTSATNILTYEEPIRN